MEKSSYSIGLMSGTSLDGLDLVLVEFTWEERHLKESVNYRIAHAKTVPYSVKWKSELSEAYKLNGNELQFLNHKLGQLFSNEINDFIEELTAGGFNKEIEFIGSHGHTVFHQPDLGYTYQIGNGPEIVRGTGIETICDFRVQDVSLGGQGAPLVPAGDAFLFRQYRACVNLGGFANISYEYQGQRVAYDIVPVNFIMNKLCLQQGFEFDKGGEIARSSEVDARLLVDLNAYDYYLRLHRPKSLGQEQIEKFYMPLIERSRLPFEIILATLVKHASEQICQVLNSLNGDVLFTGGGVYNTYLMDLIKENSKDCNIVIPENELIDFKEALIFSFLGLLRKKKQINVFASVTGAEIDHSSGRIYEPLKTN